jgi:AP2 domain
MKNDHAERWDYIQEALKDGKPTKGTDKKRKHIYRYDQPKSGRHYWRVIIRTKGDDLSKCFFDTTNGGKASALMAAISYRDKTLKERGLVNIKGLKQQPYNSDALGVCLINKKNGKYTCESWVTSWYENVNGKRIRRYKYFGVNKYGKARARQKAIKFRRDKLKELYG